jgi:EAL domain-containing protein (putative c-di-GMP-specific phosphodiesterase class I)
MHRILLVDDDPFIREGMRRLIGRHFTVDIAASGDEGLCRLRDEAPYAAVVSDIAMRGMNGVEFLEHARDLAPLTPRVILTGYPNSDVMSDAINRAGVSRFLQKPVPPEELLSCLRTCVADYDSRAAAARAANSFQIDEAWIRRALNTVDFDRDFRLTFQPRVASSNGAPLAAEALIRWHHSESGVISPGLFIPVAETGPAIREITNWVLLQTCRTWTDWHQRLDLDVAISVNISPALFRDQGLVGMVRSALGRTGMEPRRLELEITEGLELGDVERVRETIAELRALGVRLSIDDFGTGFASMNYIQALDVDCVKIDRSFVEKAPDNSTDRAILKAVRDLAVKLGLKTVAEGIETDRHEVLIREAGIDEMQGYLFAKPLAPPAYEEWVGTRRHLLPPPSKMLLLN